MATLHGVLFFQFLSPPLWKSKRLINGRYHLLRRQFIEALAVAVEPRSQPSNWHGTQGNGFRTSQTLPRRWIVPATSHAAFSPPTGHGPHSRGRTKSLTRDVSIFFKAADSKRPALTSISNGVF
jgi:hypothetical protein